ncbi:MAG: sigma 54-interacting transcriptional regulator [Eubacteriales bacterium]|nr:sigma 54-interacting transcriptional regulator [Eubacteriales bacterium]
MENFYGSKRVIEPKEVLPISAWKIDNSRKILPDELRLKVKRIHIESAGFRQICVESGNDETRIKERIRDLVIKRGKLHNPITDTGGLVYGTIEEIGGSFHNPQRLRVGQDVICNASLAAIPLYLQEIGKVHFGLSQIEAEGYALINETLPLIRKPEDLLVSLLLYTLDESGTLYSVHKCARDKQRSLVVGNSLLTNLLFGLAIRKAAGPDAEIVCLFDNNTDLGARSSQLRILLEETFTSIHYVNIVKPVECLENLDIGLFDLSVNCADMAGAETINILSTRNKGIVYFANMINNYNIALYITEVIRRQIDIRCGEGYDPDYAAFDIALLKEIAPFVSEGSLDGYTLADNVGYALRKNIKQQRTSLEQAGLTEDFICDSKAMRSVLEEILSVAKYDCNVLITGDTGVGKEKVASMIQKNSTRSNQPYIKINCASISEHLLESEFFGYEKGAFTGANAAGKKGYFEAADNGIIFLDEVGELPLDMQAKLLRVIQDGEFFRVGGTKPVKSNVRILSATNRDLEELMEVKQFRRDLFYRLNVFPIRVPPLSERRGEIPALLRHFLVRYNEKFGTVKRLEEDAIRYLASCDWPGNIRELENTLQRLMINASTDTITLLDVMRELHADTLPPEESNEEQNEREELTLKDMLEHFERGIIHRAARKYGSSRKAARGLGISQTQYIRKKNKYGLQEEE